MQRKPLVGPFPSTLAYRPTWKALGDTAEASRPGNVL